VGSYTFIPVVEARQKWVRAALAGGFCCTTPSGFCVSYVRERVSNPPGPTGFS